MKMKKSFLLSLIIHFAIIVFMGKQYTSDKAYRSSDKTIEITLIDETKQIVEQIDNNNITPKKAGFLGKSDNQTKKQTVALLAKGSSLTRKGTGYEFEESIKKGVIPIRSKNVNPLGRMLASASLRTEDNYLEIEKGAKTSLNTKEFLYFTYYSLIKEQLQGYWEYHIRQKINQLIMTNLKHVELNKKAKLLIVLNSAGSLKNLTIVKQSGLPALDEAAINTVQEAKPFPPPPRGLVQNGQVVIGWEFVVYERSKYF